MSGATMGVKTRRLGEGGPSESDGKSEAKYSVQCCSSPASRVGRLGRSLRCMFLVGMYPSSEGMGDGKSSVTSSTTSDRRMRVELYSGW